MDHAAEFIPPHTNAPAPLLAVRRFLASPFFLLFLCPAFLFVTFTGREVPAAIAGVIGISAMLILCDDVFVTTVPFFLFTVMLTGCHNSYSIFIGYAWVAAPLIAALVFHFTFYRGRYRVGASFGGLLAVSISVTLGGLGTITAAEYFNAVSLYYVGGLGFGLLGLYLLLKAQVARPRRYSLQKMLLLALFLSALYAALYVLRFYLSYLAALRLDPEEDFGLFFDHNFKTRNVLATYLMLGLPAPFYYATKKWGAFLLAVPIFGALLATGSRGGIVMGVLLLFFCFVYLLRRRKKYRVINTIFLLALILFLAWQAYRLFGDSFAFRLRRGFVTAGESRLRLLYRMFGDFSVNPVFGVGLGYTGNQDIYNPLKFAMNWYHMMLPQIVAGLGVLGCISYGVLFVGRWQLARRCPSPPSRALALSYLALFLMSQVNPGEFCPMPYALFAMMAFLFLEEEQEEGAPPPEKDRFFALSRGKLREKI